MAQRNHPLKLIFDTLHARFRAEIGNCVQFVVYVEQLVNYSDVLCSQGDAEFS